MTLTSLARPVVSIIATALLCLGLGACGSVEGETGRFEGWAQKIADIRLSSDAPPATEAARARDLGLRDSRVAAQKPLRIQVLEVHDFWDARDGGLRGLVGAAAPVMSQMTAPALTHAASDRPQTPRAVVQLGAYSSEQAARAAWSRLIKGDAAGVLAGLSPMLQTVEIDGRTLVRLRVAAPERSAAAICQAAAVADPWCRANA